MVIIHSFCSFVLCNFSVQIFYLFSKSLKTAYFLSILHKFYKIFLLTLIMCGAILSLVKRKDKKTKH